jgi:hypothetical protein
LRRAEPRQSALNGNDADEEDRCRDHRGDAWG